MNYNPLEIFGITKEEAALIRLRFICAQVEDLYARAQALHDKHQDWFKKNLKDRKECLANIKDLEERLLKWQTYYVVTPKDSEWFITDRIKVANFYLDKFKKRHYFLKKIYKERKAEEEAKKNGTPPPPRTEQYDIERIKEVPIETILKQQGYQIIKGNFFKLRNEKTPSCHFNPDKNLWYDFGSGEGGDAISLYQKINKCDFKQAIKELNHLI